MNRISILLIGTLAPSQRFPALWAWLNRRGRIQSLIAADTAMEAAVVAIIDTWARAAWQAAGAVAQRLDDELARSTPRRADTPLVGGLAAATAASLLIA